jgi:hypothetical protein
MSAYLMMGTDATNERQEPSISDNHCRHRAKFATTSEKYGHEAYLSLVGDEVVAAFLERTKKFDLVNKQWSLPQGSSVTEYLVASVFKIIRAVLMRLAKPTQPGVERDVRNVFKESSRHPKNEDGYSFSPPLVVRASGPSFESPTLVPGNDSTATRPGLAYITLFICHFKARVSS